MKLNDMVFRGVEFDYKMEWILDYLNKTDTFESRNSITSAFAHYPVITKTVVKTRMMKLEEADLVNINSEYRQNIKDKKTYKLNYNSLEQYLDMKENQGLGSELRKPHANSEDFELLKEAIEELGIENNRTRSEINSLKNTVENIKEMYNAQEKRNAEQAKDIKYWKEHAHAQEDYIRQIIEFLEDKSEFEADHT